MRSSTSTYWYASGASSSPGTTRPRTSANDTGFTMAQTRSPGSQGRYRRLPLLWGRIQRSWRHPQRRLRRARGKRRERLVFLLRPPDARRARVGQRPDLLRAARLPPEGLRGVLEGYNIGPWERAAQTDQGRINSV